MKMISGISVHVLWCLLRILQISLSIDDETPLYIDIGDGIYYIQPAHSSPSWDWSVDCFDHNAKVAQWNDFHKRSNQQFQITRDTSDGWYIIQCEHKDNCWSRNSYGWIEQRACNTADDKQKFKFIKTDDGLDQFVIEIKSDRQTLEIRSTDNNPGEQLHAGSQRSADQFQRFKITPTTGYYPYLDNGIYFIQPGSHNDWYWSVDCSLGSTKVQQYSDWHRGENQQFQLTKKSGGWYKIRCKHNQQCWDSSGSWISYGSCVGSDDGQYFRFEKAIGTADEFIIAIRYQNDYIGIRSTDNNNKEQLHADSTRSGNDYQKWKIIPASLVCTRGGITHIGVDYPMGDADEGLDLSGTHTYDNLRNSHNGWPLSVKWTDRHNNQHMVQLRDNHSEKTLYFPCSSEINWYHGGGTYTTRLDVETKWARVKFYYVSSSWFPWEWSLHHGIRVEVDGYKYKSDFKPNAQSLWEQAKLGFAINVDVRNIVSVLNGMGYMHVTSS